MMSAELRMVCVCVKHRGPSNLQLNMTAGRWCDGHNARRRLRRTLRCVCVCDMILLYAELPWGLVTDGWRKSFERIDSGRCNRRAFNMRERNFPVTADLQMEIHLGFLVTSDPLQRLAIKRTVHSKRTFQKPDIKQVFNTSCRIRKKKRTNWN